MAKSSKKPQPVLPKDALTRVSVGHSFAEYDTLLENKWAFVNTPAMAQAVESTGEKCLFVGRRGTGKTAITRFVESNKRATIIHPQTLSSANLPDGIDKFKDTRQRPFTSIVHAFKRTLLLEFLAAWIRNGDVNEYEFVGDVKRESRLLQEEDFDFKLVAILEEYEHASKSEKEWLKYLRRVKALALGMGNLSEGIAKHRILIDRVDEDWDGSDKAIVMLMALMHAAVQLNIEVSFARTMVFCRENIFERVREIDNEFARLETWIVSLDWTRELLLQLVERRLLVPFNTRTPLGGPTWDHFFELENGVSSYEWVFEQCQHRPRDVLMYVDYAIDGARARRHNQVQIEDLHEAKKKFSDSRLKDLGDEYSENFHQIQLVLARFFGLTTCYTIAAIRDIIAALIADEQIKTACGKWIYANSAPESFIGLLFDIGFIGIRNPSANIVYRSHGARAKALPKIDDHTQIEIHPTFHDALQLRDSVLTELKDATLREVGILLDIPGSIDLVEYQDKLDSLAEELSTLPKGEKHATEYEDVVGQVIKYSLFHVLTNLEPQSPGKKGRVRRDWIAANVAHAGFWNMVRNRYGATQVVFECKNYETLDSSDFQQMGYYLSRPIGGFGVIAFRGEIKNHYYEHIQRIANQQNGNAIVVLLGDRDLRVFIRQARNGGVKDGHIQDIYDKTVRKIS
ncbi:hypothetical protein CA54_04860 [Symmachiella macrocystis]|uniref:Uncharacterized protein n=1 Tax=Symmachiella macrocystis TaxID=2527985 RepID=A0A5C6BJ20_9PLAN|nr:transposase [Symmachiella macrocystis]TWU11677.1 hypothetical protein CA54_04860 [Symmachiella macrocystis]